MGCAAMPFRSLSNNATANGITESKMDLRIHITHEHVATLCVYTTHSILCKHSIISIYIHTYILKLRFVRFVLFVGCCGYYCSTVSLSLLNALRLYLFIIIIIISALQPSSLFTGKYSHFDAAVVFVVVAVAVVLVRVFFSFCA